jgi:hypothetical protein
MVDTIIMFTYPTEPLGRRRAKQQKKCGMLPAFYRTFMLSRNGGFQCTDCNDWVMPQRLVTSMWPAYAYDSRDMFCLLLQILRAEN